MTKWLKKTRRYLKGVIFTQKNSRFDLAIWYLKSDVLIDYVSKIKLPICFNYKTLSLICKFKKVEDKPIERSKFICWRYQHYHHTTAHGNQFNQVEIEHQLHGTSFKYDLFNVLSYLQVIDYRDDFLSELPGRELNFWSD